MKSFLNSGAKQLLLGVVVSMLALGPLQPLIAQAQSSGGITTGPTLEQAGLVTTGPTLEQAGLVTTGPTAEQAGKTLSNDGTTATSPGIAQQPTVKNPQQCDWTGNYDLCITNVVYVFTVGIGSGFAYVAASFFNLAVNLSLNGPAYALTFVSTGWTTARDLANMAFLFILIYIAFMIMLEAETGNTMSLLAGVIVIALLVNFSFFFTRLVVDAGNILSIQFYNSITAPSVQATAQSANGSNLQKTVTAATGVGATTKDLTASIMGMLQLQNLFNTTSFDTFYNSNKNAPGGFLVVVVTLSFLYIAAGIMFYLLTVMFVTAGVKFLVRIVILWFLIIASPLAFVARAMPPGNKLRGYFDQWRSMLVSHAFYPVAFMFIFLILTNFTNQMGNCTNSGGTSSQSCLINDIFTTLPAGATTSGSATASIALAIANVAIRMGFIIAILYLGMKASDKVGVMGADAAKSAGKWAGGAYKGATMGLASRAGGFAYRETIGRAGQNNIDYLKANPPKTRLGQYFDYALRKSVLAPMAGSSVGGVKSYTDAEKYRKERNEDLVSNRRSVQTKDDLSWMTENSTQYGAAKKKATLARTAEEQKLVDEGDRIKTRMKGFGKKDFEATKFSDIKSMVSVITESQLKTIKDGNNINEQEKEDLTTEWNTHNPASAYQKAHKEIDELRTIAAELHRAGITLSKIDTHIGGAATAARSGALVTKDIVKDMHKEAKVAMATLDQNIADANKTGSTVPKNDIIKMRDNKDKLKEAMEHMTKLATETGNVQANIGEEKEEGKFKTK